MTKKITITLEESLIEELGMLSEETGKKYRGQVNVIVDKFSML